MHDREHVVVRRIVALDRIEIWPEQERGPARDRHPQLCGEARIRKRLSIRARDPHRLPRRIAARCLIRAASGSTDLVAPVFATPVFSAIDQIPRARTERIVWLAERI